MAQVIFVRNASFSQERRSKNAQENPPRLSQAQDIRAGFLPDPRKVHLFRKVWQQVEPGTELGVGPVDREPSGLLSLGLTSAVLKGNLEVHGSTLIRDRCQADRGCNTTELENFSQPVTETGETRPQLLEARIERFDETMGQSLAESFWAEDMPGHSDTIKNYMFSYRTTDQYGADRYAFEEPYWMELYGEAACSSLATWAEPVYTYQEETQQQPWPGHSVWAERESMAKLDSRYFDPETGKDRDTGKDRESLETGQPETGQPEKVVPDKHLRIIDPI